MEDVYISVAMVVSWCGNGRWRHHSQDWPRFSSRSSLLFVLIHNEIIDDFWSVSSLMANSRKSAAWKRLRTERIFSTKFATPTFIRQSPGIFSASFTIQTLFNYKNLASRMWVNNKILGIWTAEVDFISIPPQKYSLGPNNVVRANVCSNWLTIL